MSYLDLTLPQYGLPLYDWVISLEVAEHIPAESEAIYLDNIVRHAREGVVLSWAVPGNNLFLYVTITLMTLAHKGNNLFFLFLLE